MQWLYFTLGLLTGLASAALFYIRRQRRRPRADVHLRVRKGQSSADAIADMVDAINRVGDWKDRAEKAESANKIMAKVIKDFEEEKKRR